MTQPCLGKKSIVREPAHGSGAHALLLSSCSEAGRQDWHVVQGEAVSEWISLGSGAVLLVPQAVGHWILTGVASISRGC